MAGFIVGGIMGVLSLFGLLLLKSRDEAAV